MFTLQCGIRLPLPVIAGINRQGGTRLMQLSVVVAWTLCQRHTASIEQVKAWGAVAAIVTGGGTLYLWGSHVQTHTWTCNAMSLTLRCRHVHHTLWTHTWGCKHMNTHLHTGWNNNHPYCLSDIHSFTHYAAPEQGWELQSLVWMCGPGQLVPPCCGVGELQNRSLIWTPESHFDEHWDHWDHADQPPFTESKYLKLVFILHISAVDSIVFWVDCWDKTAAARKLLDAPKFMTK